MNVDKIRAILRERLPGQIHIDSNEASVCPGIADRLRKFGATVVVRPLETGDYFICGKVLVERKGAGDLLRSIGDGAIFDQLERMKNLPTIEPIFLIEGSLHEALKYRKWNLASVYGALNSLFFDWDAKLMFVDDQRQAAEWLLSLYKKYSNENSNAEIPARRFKREATSMSEIQRRVIEGFPKVGSLTSIKAMEHFKTLVNLVCADQKALQHIFGPKLGAKIHKINNFSYRKKHERGKEDEAD